VITDVTELPECLQRSLQMRVPAYDRTMTARQRIELLEDYLLESAIVQGELTEERAGWMVTLIPLQHEWDHLAGWEDRRRTRTEAGVRDAKRAVRPDLYDEIEEVNWMIKRLTEEVDRMERDASKVSRAYSMETAG
jgi:hypothetical protein